MKKMLMILLVCFTINSYAQSEYNYRGIPFDSEWFLFDGIVAPKNQTIEIKTTNLKNKKEKIVRKSYNSFAKLTEAAEIKENETNLLQSNTYNEDGKLLVSNWYVKGKLVTEYNYKRDKENRTTEFYKKRKGKLKSYSTYTYHTPKEHCYSQAILYKNDGETAKNIWDYEYYDDACDRKKSTLKNRKGKILKTWTYDCKQEGEELTKKKDVNQICKWEESDGEHLKKVYQSFDDKGKIYTRTNLYRKSDTAFISSTSNYSNGRKYENTYDPDTKKILTSHNINKKGVITYGRTYVYEGKNLLSTTLIRKGKVRSTKEYTYNSDGNLMAYKYYKTDGKLVKSSVLTYK